MNKILLCSLMSFPMLAIAMDLPATLQWSQRVELAAPASGVVQQVHVHAGDRVKKGQVLVTLDPAAYSAGVAESRADLARSQEEEQEAKRNLDRVEELYNRTVISISELELAQTRHARAKAQSDGARAKLAATQARLRDASLRAPFDGIVLLRQVEPGQAVASLLQPQPLIVLARSGEMVARGKASLAQIEKLKVGDAVTVEVNKQSYTGKIKTLGLEPAGEKGDIGYPVDALFEVKQVLRAGTPATLKLP